MINQLFSNVLTVLQLNSSCPPPRYLRTDNRTKSPYLKLRILTCINILTFLLKKKHTHTYILPQTEEDHLTTEHIVKAVREIYKNTIQGDKEEWLLKIKNFDNYLSIEKCISWIHFYKVNIFTIVSLPCIHINFLCLQYYWTFFFHLFNKPEGNMTKVTYELQQRMK